MAYGEPIRWPQKLYYFKLWTVTFASGISFRDVSVNIDAFVNIAPPQIFLKKFNYLLCDYSLNPVMDFWDTVGYSAPCTYGNIVVGEN